MKTVNKLIIAGLLLASFVSADTIPTISPFKQTATSIVPINKSLELVIGRGLTLGNSTSTLAGTIRWTGLAWEGYNGASWTSLGGGGSGITTLNGLTDSTQTFSTSSLVTGLKLNLTSSAGNHAFSLATSSGYSLILLTDISKLNALDNASTSWVNYTYASTSYLLKGTVSDTKYCVWDNANGKVNCNAEGGTGFTTTSINGLATTTFSFTTSSDTNIGIIIATSTNGVSFTPTWIGTLADGRIASAVKWNALDTASTTWSTYSYNSSTFPTFTYISSSFATSGQVITDHSLLTNKDYASAGHTGFEPTVTKGNLTNGNNITIGGSGTGAVIGTGASVALNDTISLTGVSSTYATHTLSKITNASTTNLTNSGNAYLGVTRFTGITGLTQCLNVDENGVVSGTGAACGSGSGGINSLAGQTGASQTISTGTKPTGLDFKVVSGSNDHQFILTIDSGLFIPSSSPAFASITTTNLWAGGLKYPTADGTGSQCLKTNGSGVLSFGDCSTGGGSFTTTSINGLATTTFSFATGTDTNIGINITTSTAGLTFTPTWTGTLADARITSAAKWNALDTASTSWATYAYNSSTFPTFAYGTSTYVPYTGANANVDLGAYKLTATNVSTTNFTASTNLYWGTNNGLMEAVNGVVRATSTSNFLTTGTASATYVQFSYASSTFPTFSYVSSSFATSGQVITDHSKLSNLTYAASGHTGFEPTVTKGNLTNGSNITIGGTGTGAVIGSGASVALNDTITLTGVSSTYATATLATITNVSSTNLTVSGNSYLGTVKSGTWNGSIIGADYLGSGSPTANTILFGDGSWKATSSLGIPTHNAVTIGTPANGLSVDANQVLSIGLAATNATGSLSATDWNTFNNKQNALTTGNLSVGTGLAVDNTRQVIGGALTISAASGYGIPLTASTTNWNNFYDTPSTRITAGTLLSWSGNTLNGSSSPTFDSLWTTNASTTNLTVASNLYWGANNGLLEAVNGVVRATSTDNFLTTGTASATYVPFSYASSTFVPFSYASSTFSTFAYNSSTFPTFGYASSSYLLRSLLTAKGSLISYSNQPAELTVGGDGQKLIASSTAATGLAWASSTVVIPVSPSGFFNSDNDIFGNTPYSYSIYQMTCKLRGAVTSTLPTVTMTIANAAGSTVGTLLCNTSTAFYTTTTITNGNISANSNLMWTASNASGTFNGVLISVHATK